MDPPLWRCPACGRTFANRNQTHTCAVLGDLDAHFARSLPAVRATFDRICAVPAGCGPFEVLPERTRIALHVRLNAPDEVDDEFAGWLVEAYRVGAQRH